MKSNSLFKFIGEIRRESKIALPLILVYAVFQGFYPLINIVRPKYIIDEILNLRRVDYIVSYICLLALANFIFQIVISNSKNRLDQIYFELRMTSFNKLGQKSIEMDIEIIEKKSTLDQKERGRHATYEVERLGIAISTMLAALITIVSTSGILMKNDYRLIFVVLIANLLTIPCFNKIKELEVDNNKRGIPENRAFLYLISVSTDFRFAKDLRLYGGREFFMKKAKLTMDRIIEINHEYFTKSGFWMGLVEALVQIQLVVTFGILGLSLLTYRISVGSFTMLYGASSQLGKSFSKIMEGLTDLITLTYNLDPYYEFMEVETASQTMAKNKIEKEEGVSLVFENICFKYPTSESYVLEDLSFQVKAGESLALVGKNGAGKTTIIKLLTRLYRPTSGRILFNGLDIETLDLEEYRRELSVVFQDFKLLPTQVDENLLCKEEDKITKEDLESLEDKLGETGIKTWIDGQERGSKSYISKLMDEKGLLPSGGQEQKLAISRALVRDGSIVILDEPTAALDPKSEEEVFENLIKLSRGKTSIFISHRLSSTRIADRIVLVDKGKIIEEGSHSELVSSGGLYANMYKTQAKQYLVD